MRRALLLLPLLLLLPAAAHAQSIAIDLGAAGTPSVTSRLVQLVAFVTVLSLAPSLLVMATAFIRIVVVLSILRGALGTQSAPPNMVLIGLALFLTFFVMQPVLDRAWTDGIAPMTAGTIDEIEGLRRTAEPFRGFMVAHARQEDLVTFLDLGHMEHPAEPAATPWRALLPAFIVSEMRRAFEMGFIIYLPFLVIDIIVSGILMSLGMMMIPPNAISLPLKLIFFVMADGWRLISESLVRSYGG